MIPNFKMSLSCFVQYEDDEDDKVLLTTDSDLVGAVYHARFAGWKVNFLLTALVEVFGCLHFI